VEAESRERSVADGRLESLTEQLRASHREQVAALRSMVESCVQATARAEAAAEQARLNLEALGEGVRAGMDLLKDVRDSCRRELEGVAGEAVEEARRAVGDASDAVERARASAEADVRLVAEDGIGEVRAAARAEAARLAEAGRHAARSVEASRGPAAAEAVPAAAPAEEPAMAREELRQAMQEAEQRAAASVCEGIARGLGLARADAASPAALARAVRELVERQVAEQVSSAVAAAAPRAGALDAGPAVAALPSVPAGAGASQPRPPSPSVAGTGTAAAVDAAAVTFRRCVHPLRVAADLLAGTAAFEAAARAGVDESSASLLLRQAHTGTELHLAELRLPDGPRAVVLKRFPPHATVSGPSLEAVMRETAALLAAQGHPGVLRCHGLLHSPGRAPGLVMQEAGAFFIAPRGFMSVVLHMLLGGPDFGLTDDMTAAELAEHRVVGSLGAAPLRLAPGSHSRAVQGAKLLPGMARNTVALLPLTDLAATAVVRSRVAGSVTAAQLAVRTPPSAWPYSAPVTVVRSLADLLRATTRAADDALALLAAIAAALGARVRDAQAAGDDAAAEEAAEVRDTLDNASAKDGVPLAVPEAGAEAAAAQVTWQILPLRARLELLAGAASGLAHLHAHGMMHGDVKPANVFLVGDRGCIGDFGTATRLQAIDKTSDGGAGQPGLLRRLASSSSAIEATGTDAFIAPEAWRREDDGSAAAPASPADVWSFGMTVFAAMDAGLVDPLERAASRLGLDEAEDKQLLLEHGARPRLEDLAAAGLLPPGAALEGEGTAWQAVASLVAACLGEAADERPSMDECARRLREAAELCR